jgi:hypothetical protein
MTRQNKILTAYFIFGLPGLPIACIMWLLGKYIIQNEEPFGNKVGFCSIMIASTVFMVLYLLLFKLCL